MQNYAFNFRESLQLFKIPFFSEVMFIYSLEHETIHLKRVTSNKPKNNKSL